MSDSLRPLYSPWILGQNTGEGSLTLLQGIFPTQGSNPGLPHCRRSLDKLSSFTSWAQGKPKNTGVSSLSLLQLIFPTQELNQGLLLCRWILYQLRYQGSPFYTKSVVNRAIIYSPLCSMVLFFRINTLIHGEFTLWRKDWTSFSFHLTNHPQIINSLPLLFPTKLK